MDAMLLASLVLLLVPACVAQSASVHEQQGRKYEADGALANAAAEYEKAIELSPYEQTYYFEAAHVRLVRQEFEAAVKILERGCRIFDKSAQLELALGVAYYGERRFGDAAGAFLRTIDIAPEVQQPYVFLSKMLDQVADRLPQILPRFESWAATNLDDARAQFVYAKGLIASGDDSDKPERLLRASIRLKGDQWESHYELGILLEKQRKFIEAAPELEKSAAINPNEAGVRYHLARVYDRLGESDKAEAQRAVHRRLTDSPGGK
jgi:tetratricopeptide (TPR) repeat protein